MLTLRSACRHPWAGNPLGPCIRELLKIHGLAAGTGCGELQAIERVWRSRRRLTDSRGFHQDSIGPAQDSVTPRVAATGMN
jgi:hypothetical protein